MDDDVSPEGDPKPVWLLDIDGVLNAHWRGGDGWPQSDFCVVKQASHGHVWTVRVARPVIDFVNEVHNQGLAEIRWHTTWQGDANILAPRLGLPEFAVHEAPEYAGWQLSGRGGMGWWKWPGMARVIEEEKRPLVITDDDFWPDMIPADGFERLKAGRCLMVRPNDQTGLLRRQLQSIWEFLGGHPDGWE